MHNENTDVSIAIQRLLDMRGQVEFADDVFSSHSPLEELARLYLRKWAELSAPMGDDHYLPSRVRNDYIREQVTALQSYADSPETSPAFNSAVIKKIAALTYSASDTVQELSRISEKISQISEKLSQLLERVDGLPKDVLSQTVPPAHRHRRVLRGGRFILPPMGLPDLDVSH